MPEPLSPALDRLRDLLLDEAGLVRAVGGGRRRGSQPSWRRVELRYVDLTAGRRLQVTTYDQTQAHTRNVTLGDAPTAVDELLAEPFGNWRVDAVRETVQLRVTKRGEAQVHTETPQTAEQERQPVRAHDRAKARLLDPTEPFLAELGVATRDGKVKTSRGGKYHQVEEFVRLTAPTVDDALAAGHVRTPNPDDPLRIVDLGCGNAYLTFAAYRFFAGLRGLPVRLTGVDVKAQARAHNTAVAERLGWTGSLRFVEGDIATAPIEDAGRTPDVVLALHACDTATDDALARAVRARAPLIFAAPCCHHDLQTQLRGQPAPEPYGLLTRHGALRERLTDVLTDALRAAVLRLLGYRVDVVEFVGSEHTPRNLLLRAVYTGAPPGGGQEYRELTETWGVRPALARELRGELAEVLAR